MKPKWSRKKITVIVLGVFLALIVGIGVYGFSIYHAVKETVDEKMYKPVEAIVHTPDQKVKIEKQKPLNILLVGVDERKNDKGRSDTLIILSINPNIDSMQMISIPRDTRTELVGLGFEDKINHAYAYGDINTTIETVEAFADIELDYYVKMNMEGLVDLVDAVGGITINNPYEWKEPNFHYKKGELTMNGEQTMGFVRMRYYDSDFNRNDRQRIVISGIIKKGANIGSITKIDEILDVLGKNMETNLTFNDMVNLFKNYRDARLNTITHQVTGEGTYLENSNGQMIYYLIVSDEERQKVHDLIMDFNNKG
jgi:polyisoprenyl-teichoic acid--peptidoglycan teichoic acid transferase